MATDVSLRTAADPSLFIESSKQRFPSILSVSVSETRRGSYALKFEALNIQSGKRRHCLEIGLKITLSSFFGKLLLSRLCNKLFYLCILEETIFFSSIYLSSNQVHCSPSNFWHATFLFFGLGILMLLLDETHAVRGYLHASCTNKIDLEVKQRS